MASFKCRDIGMNCGFEIKDENKDELMSLIATHAAKTHKLTTVPPETMDKIKKAIKQEPAMAKA